MLTKSNYLLGLQCHKLLHIAKNNKDRLPEVDISKHATKDGIGHGRIEYGNWRSGIKELKRAGFRKEDFPKYVKKRLKNNKAKYPKRK
jgi:hypothetical protein